MFCLVKTVCGEDKKGGTKMAETKLTDEQVANMLSIIADKHGAKLTSIDVKEHWIEIDCPESQKVDCSVEIERTIIKTKN